MPIMNTVIAGGGTTPTGTLPITNNGTYDVTNYASADVQVPTTAPALYREFQLDGTGKLVPNTTTTHIMDFTGITDVSNYALARTYYQNTAISGSVDMSDLVTLSSETACFGTFQGCSGITSADLSSLTTISGSQACSNMFASSGITSIDLSSLTTISGTGACSSMFNNCSGLTSVNLFSLTSITGASIFGSAFQYCNGIVISFPSITPNSFGTRTNQFANMVYQTNNVTFHFPSNTQAKIETLNGYSTTAPFGATSGTVLFDLPATNTLTGADTVTYTRNPKYDTATALAWKVGAYGTTDFTPAYYTSGTTDPAVSDTIYSDSACTTPVTTISSIA